MGTKLVDGPCPKLHLRLDCRTRFDHCRPHAGIDGLEGRCGEQTSDGATTGAVRYALAQCLGMLFVVCEAFGAVVDIEAVASWRFWVSWVVEPRVHKGGAALS